MDPFLGQVILFGGNFAPRGWALCEGQLLSIAQNTALFSILGTTYGGDGRTTFGLPDLRGRVAVSAGRGPGLSDYRLGQKNGAETTTLNQLHLPPHSHSAALNHGGEENLSPVASGKRFASEARGGDTPPSIYTTAANAGTLASDAVSIGNTGGGQAFNNVQPVQALNYIIALQGTFPSRN